MSYDEYIHVISIPHEQELINAYDQCIHNHNVEHAKHVSEKSHVIPPHGGTPEVDHKAPTGSMATSPISLFHNVTSPDHLLIKKLRQEYQHYTASMSKLNEMDQPITPYSHDK